MSDETRIRQWLASPEGQTALTRAAKDVLRYACHLNLPLLLDDSGAAVRRMDAEALGPLRSELALFLLENRSDVQRRLAAAQGGGGGLLRNLFIRHCRDRARRREDSPHRYLYKRLADALRKDPGFFTVAVPGSHTTFSMTRDSPAIQPLAEEDLRRIEFPVHVVKHLDFDAVNRKQPLLHLAAHFWRQVVILCEDRPVRVNVRDLVRWIFLHVPAPATDAQGEPDLSPEPAPFDPERLKGWARQFSASLSTPEKAIFYLKHGEQMSLEDITQRLPYHQGPSGVHHRIKVVEHKLRAFIMSNNLPWLTMDELNLEAFSCFSNELLLILKKSVPAP